MRNLLVVFLILVTSIAATAQPTFGIHVNGIMPRMSEDNFLNNSSGVDPMEGFDWKKKTKISWKVGAVMSLPLTEYFSLMPQLNLLSKGGKFNTSGSEVDQGVSVNYEFTPDFKLLYLELPLNIVYNTETFFIGAGPSLSYGLGGELEFKYKISAPPFIDESDTETDDVKFDDDDEAEHISFKALEIGANVIAGYKFANGFFINAHYNMGLNNISPYENTKVKNRYFGIGIGYFFPSRQSY